MDHVAAQSVRIVPVNNTVSIRLSDCLDMHNMTNVVGAFRNLLQYFVRGEVWSASQ